MEWTDPLLAGRSTPVSSCTLDKPEALGPVLLEGCVDPGPKLDPRPLALLGGGDAMRMAGASKLAALRWDLEGIGGT